MIEPYTDEIKFQVGERVRVSIQSDITKPEDIDNDKATIIGIDTRFAASPELREVTYKVWLDGSYFRNPVAGNIKHKTIVFGEQLTRI